MFMVGSSGKVILGGNCLLILSSSCLRWFGSIIWGVNLPVVNVDRYDLINSMPYCLWYGRMVKALTCQVEGPRFESHHGKKFWKSLRKSFGLKKKKKARYPLLA